MGPCRLRKREKEHHLIHDGIYSCHNVVTHISSERSGSCCVVLPQAVMAFSIFRQFEQCIDNRYSRLGQVFEHSQANKRFRIRTKKHGLHRYPQYIQVVNGKPLAWPVRESRWLPNTGANRKTGPPTFEDVTVRREHRSFCAAKKCWNAGVWISTRCCNLKVTSYNRHSYVGYFGMIFGGLWLRENLSKAIWHQHAPWMAHDDNFWMNLVNHNVEHDFFVRISAVTITAWFFLVIYCDIPEFELLKWSRMWR